MNKPVLPVPRWMGPVVLGLLAGQLALLWVQGGLLNRQHQDLMALREDVQILTETLEDTLMPAEDENGMLPMKVRPRKGKTRIQRVSVMSEDPEPAARELEASRESARKAVEQARDAQQKLSIQENARKAEEAAKVRRAQGQGQTWLLVALVAGLLALVIRTWLRRRA